MRSRCGPDAMPYPDACDRVEPAYSKLIGANLVQGFRKRLHDDMGGVRGCTHVTELLGSLPTAAVQTFAGLRREDEGDAQAVPARPLPRAGDHDGHGSPLLPAGGTAARREWQPGSQRENPRIPGQGNLPQVRDADAARHSGVHRRRGRRRGRLARRQRLGRQGADPRRRPRQGRRRQGRAIAGRGARSRRQDSRHAARHAPDGSGGAEGAPAADRGGRGHPAGALRRAWSSTACRSACA